ncbi:MAG: hypothetical protein JWL98_278, partial [Xanthomonadaceae bacterium]|nr:hypothetical protein [Xanthomonadaceae bacterium]
MANKQNLVLLMSLGENTRIPHGFRQHV